MSQFSIDEIAITHYPGNHLHGQEVTIIGLNNKIRMNPSNGKRSPRPAYKIRYADGDSGYATEEKLRKKKKKKEKASWENIEEVTGWNPTTKEIVI